MRVPPDIGMSDGQGAGIEAEGSLPLKTRSRHYREAMATAGIVPGRHELLGQHVVE
jgi:hypothetical protein